MVQKWSIEDLRALSVEERLHLVEELWDSILEVPEAVPLTDAQRQELEKRIADYHRDPSACLPWDVVRAQILSQLSS